MSIISDDDRFYAAETGTMRAQLRILAGDLAMIIRHLDLSSPAGSEWSIEKLHEVADQAMEWAKRADEEGEKQHQRVLDNIRSVREEAESYRVSP